MAERATAAVIIAAWSAAPRIGRAIASALAQPEAAQVIVVDDASPDGTEAAARAADDGSGRLEVIRLAANGGPAAARNRALARVRAPWVAILDSDDLFAPGRLEALLQWPDFDMIADDVLFVADDGPAAPPPAPAPAPPAPPRPIGLAAFIEANISRPGRPKRELGFLKPVFRTEFLRAHQLAYDEALRLGEDFELYTRALAHGARFGLVARCGYLATVRADSLSGRHRTADLEALMRADARLLERLRLAPDARRALLRHHAHVAAKYRHRAFLDAKRETGLARALAATRPGQLAGIAAAIAADKWRALGRRGTAPAALPHSLMGSA